MGVVYHTHYLDYFEMARTEALRERGVVYKTLEENGVMMPVIDLSVRYKRPALYDDLLHIKSVVAETPRTRIRIDYEVRRAGETAVLATGHVTLCFIDAVNKRPTVAPPSLVALFEHAS